MGGTPTLQTFHRNGGASRVGEIRVEIIVAGEFHRNEQWLDPLGYTDSRPSSNHAGHETHRSGGWFVRISRARRGLRWPNSPSKSLEATKSPARS